VPRGERDGSLLPYSRLSKPEPLLFLPNTPQLYSRGWVSLVPAPLLLRKYGSWESNPNLWICSQELWPLDHRVGLGILSLILKVPSSTLDPRNWLFWLERFHGFPQLLQTIFRGYATSAHIHILIELTILEFGGSDSWVGIEMSLKAGVWSPRGERHLSLLSSVQTLSGVRAPVQWALETLSLESKNQPEGKTDHTPSSAENAWVLPPISIHFHGVELN
jgi:hypothetical protein